ncbi:MAG: B12-binding domain-containing radical SAM protein [Candidatus Thorarchaeota archaeon]
MAQLNNGTKIVLTASEIEMSHFGDDPFGAFAGSFLLIPSFLKPFYMPKEADLPNEQARIAPYGLRKVEALLLNHGFAESDVAVVHPQKLKKFIGPNTKAIGISSMDPLGIAYVSLTYSNMFALGMEPRNRIEFRNLLRKSPIAKVRDSGQAKVIVGGAGAWQVTGPTARKTLGIDSVITGEVGQEVIAIFQQALNGDTVPATARGNVLRSEADIPIIRGGSLHGTVEITRGCGRGCQFCSPTQRRRFSLPIDHIMKEVKVNTDAGNDMIILATEDLFLYGLKSSRFIPNRKAILNLIHHLVRAPGVRYIQPAHIALAPVVVDPKCIEEAAELLVSRGRYKHGGKPYVTAEAGIETGSVRLFKQRMAGKTLPFKPEEWPEVVKQALGILNDNRWFPLTTWLVGLPGEDEEDVNATLELLDDLKGMKLFITPLLWVPLRPSILSEGSRPEIEALTDLQWEVFTRAWQFNLDVWRPHANMRSWKNFTSSFLVPIFGSLIYFLYAKGNPAASMVKRLLFHSFDKAFFDSA